MCTVNKKYEDDYLKCKCGWEGFASALLAIETGGGSCYFGCPDCKKEDDFILIKNTAVNGGGRCRCAREIMS